MIIEGGVTAPVWCYFITEVQRQVFPKMLKRNPGMKKEDILLLYDNCKSHNKSISTWWMRNIDAFKLTICPYTPEFNPIELLFRTLKFSASDGVERNTLLALTEFLVWHMNKIKRNTFISYFQLCISEMAEHILTFCNLKDDNYPNPKDKLPWKTGDNRQNKYYCDHRRFIFLNKEDAKNFMPPEKLPEDRWK